MPEENFIKLHKGGYTGDKTQMIFVGGTFRHISMLSGKMLYVDDAKFRYTACQWNEAEAVREVGNRIHPKMYGNLEERRVKVWFLYHKS